MPAIQPDYTPIVTPEMRAMSDKLTTHQLCELLIERALCSNGLEFVGVQTLAQLSALLNEFNLNY